MREQWVRSLNIPVVTAGKDQQLKHTQYINIQGTGLQFLCEVKVSQSLT